MSIVVFIENSKIGINQTYKYNRKFNQYQPHPIKTSIAIKGKVSGVTTQQHVVLTRSQHHQLYALSSHVLERVVQYTHKYITCILQSIQNNPRNNKKMFEYKNHHLILQQLPALDLHQWQVYSPSVPLHIQLF